MSYMQPPRLLRQICLLGIVSAILSVASGCTWQQAYAVRQEWQRNACNRFIEQTERERCLSNTNMSYDEYRRRIGGAVPVCGNCRGGGSPAIEGRDASNIHL